jgi:hypothetical protein
VRRSEKANRRKLNVHTFKGFAPTHESRGLRLQHPRVVNNSQPMIVDDQMDLGSGGVSQAHAEERGG